MIEGDEYDTAFFDKGPKSLHYRAAGAIVTSVEFDHADIYRNLDHVKSSFRKLSDQLDADRVLVVSADSPAALEVSASTRARRVTFGLGVGAYRAIDISIDSHGARFAIARAGERIADDVRLPIGGRMNVANALGVFALLSEFEVGPGEIVPGLASFKGVARRQEIVGEAPGIIVVDDFAHHPTAIRATLEAIGDFFAGRRILAAFEPRSNTSRRSVSGRTSNAPSIARRDLPWSGLLRSRTIRSRRMSGLDTEALASAISKRGPVPGSHVSQPQKSSIACWPSRALAMSRCSCRTDLSTTCRAACWRRWQRFARNRLKIAGGTQALLPDIPSRFVGGLQRAADGFGHWL